MAKPTTPRGGAPRAAGVLPDEIERGALEPAERIPTITPLAAYFGVNENTARTAIVTLDEQGVLSGPAGGDAAELCPGRWRTVPPGRGLLVESPRGRRRTEPCNATGALECH
ncbi:GntR family transcriptional regulator [Streptomyces sp. NPDC096012]|uniref:GntR family transcriptional regulator n=1 Tax=Streptomyces sp. NPDC096012 TaxID=3155684 RepID=UPI00336ADD16